MAVQISVIVPVYNMESYLERCLDSLRAQIFTDFEVLIIDDGSIDQSAKIGKAYAETDARFHYLWQKNQGVSVARNKGLEIANGEYVVFVDSDDYVSENYLLDFVQCMIQQNVDIVVCGYYECYEQKGIKEEKNYCDGMFSIREYLNQMSRNPVDNYYGCLWNKCYRKEIIIQNGLQFETEKSYGEDTAFLMDYLKVVENVYILPIYTYYYLFDRNGSLGKGKDDIDERAKEVAYVYEKYVELWKYKGFYRKSKKRVQYLGIRLFFEESKKRTKDEKRILCNNILIENDFSRGDILIFLLLRKIKHLLRR